MKEFISTASAPQAIGPYSQAVSVGGWLFCSGQIPLDPSTGEIVEGGIEVQTRRVLENLRAVLAAGGVGVESVVKTTVFLADLADFAVMNRIYAEYFGEASPARSTVQVAGLPRGARIEVEAVAVAPSRA